MRRFLFAPLACLLLLTVAVSSTVAQDAAPFGQVVATLPVPATLLLSDPFRHWVYAATSDKTITVIDTATLGVLATIPIGIRADQMTLSENGARLYASSLNAPVIKVLNTNLLKVADTLHPMSGSVNIGNITGLAAGHDNRLYVTAALPDSALYQVEATTGQVQASIASTNYVNTPSRYLAISADRNTLYASNYSRYPAGSSLNAYDVSGPTAQSIGQRASESITTSSREVADHSGRYLLLTSASDASATPHHDAVLLSGADISQCLSTLDRGDNIIDGPLAFSLDDSVVFQAFSHHANGAAPYTQIEMWRTADGTRLDKTALTYPDRGKHALSSLTVDASGAYLLAAQQDDSDPDNPVGVVTVLGTGFPPPPAPALKPVVSVTTRVADTALGQPPGRWQLSRTGSDLSQPLTVTYTLIGTAVNSYDYHLRRGISTFPAGSRHVNVTIVPKRDLEGEGTKAVRLILHPSDQYRRGDSFKGRIILHDATGG